jgi:DNA uptake protein ComE-like DNA-binding protein
MFDWSMNYSNDENKLVGAEPAAAQQEVGVLAITFFSGLVLSLCFALPILRHSERTVFAQAGRLNPNAATVYELAELPNLGPAKAEAIVEYRQGIRRRHPTSILRPSLRDYGGQVAKGYEGTGYGGQEQKAFENAGDLENVKGIGEKTVEKIKEWLVFE